MRPVVLYSSNNTHHSCKRDMRVGRSEDCAPRFHYGVQIDCHRRYQALPVPLNSSSCNKEVLKKKKKMKMKMKTTNEAVSRTSR